MQTKKKTSMKARKKQEKRMKKKINKTKPIEIAFKKDWKEGRWDLILE